MTRSFQISLCLLALGCGHQPAPKAAAPAPDPMTSFQPAVAVTREEAPAAPPPAEPAPAPGPRRIEVTPAEALSVGKWPEGIAVSDDALWVAESGARRVTRFGRSENVSGHTSQVGRLPVDMVRDAGGNLYAMVATDEKIVAIHPASGKVSTVVKVPAYPEGLAEARGVLYVLMWPGNNSMDSSLLRVDPKTRATKASGSLGDNAFDVAAGHGRVWVARRDALTVVDAESLERVAEVAIDDRPYRVLSGPNGVYVGTARGVVRVDPETLRVSHQFVLDHQVTALATYGDQLAVGGENGTIHLLDAGTLAARTELVPTPVQPQAMVALGDALFVSTHRGDGPGAVLVFRPTAEQPWQ